MNIIEPRNPGGQHKPASTWWPHTGIEAPHRLELQNLTEIDHGPGTAFTADLVHPHHGVIGRVSDSGPRGDTEFYTRDATVFGYDHLVAFTEQCRQDGEPLPPRWRGTTALLNAVVDESETARIVNSMRRSGTFLLRSYAPRSEYNGGAQRGQVLSTQMPLLSKAARETLAARLAAEPEHALLEDEIWQMFNGQQWTPMLPGPQRTAEQTIKRLAQVSAVRIRPDQPLWSRWSTEIEPGLYATGNVGADRFTVSEDSEPMVNCTEWCPCGGERETSRFETWNGHGLIEAGTVHARKRCRRLIAIE
ncbi:hypothetical protein D5S17_35695 [Pseudonocardiaceae bacterium YIM PH 21723]|nr:hypothetical protein D5S17_35695 [Pseudonocardiaceae bacterium YIM PH 21723]